MIEVISEYLAETEVLNFLVIDDDKNMTNYLSKKLSTNFEGVQIETGKSPESVFSEIPINKPKVIILDWLFICSGGQEYYDCTKVLPYLSKYNGLICIFSNRDASDIRKDIKVSLGAIPKNFKIFNKFNYSEMENEIINYLADHF